jgi:hypothetical protein
MGGKSRQPVGHKGATLPYGVRHRDLGNRNSGHSPDHRYGRIFFSMTCPYCLTTFHVGAERVTTCGNCLTPLPRGGYI